MEKLGQIIKAQQSGESTAVTLVSDRSLTVESLRQLGLMLQQMSAAFPHQEVPPETAEVFYMTFEDLAIQYGMKSLETALRSFLTRQKFFPHPSEVAEVLEEMKQKSNTERMASLPKIGCEKCGPEGSDFPGYVYVEKPGFPRAVTDCACRIRREQAKRALEAKP